MLRQGGDSNTIAIVNGVKKALTDLVDVPKELITKVVFDQSIFVKNAIKNLIHEGTLGLILTALMVFIFLGSLRATLGVFFSIPLSVLGTFAILSLGDNTINTMILGGFALSFSRLIDNSVVVLENIYRHLELGESSQVAAEKGAREVALPVLASTLTTAIVFFPVTLLYGVSQFLFSALALAVVIALFASYIIALTVVPLFCAKFLKKDHGQQSSKWFNHKFEAALGVYDTSVKGILRYPQRLLGAFLGFFLLSCCMAHFLGISYFPRTDPGQFIVNLKAPSGTRLELTEQEVAKVEGIIRRIVDPVDLNVIVSNIGAAADFSAIYTSNTASHTAFVQASFKENHKVSSYEYMERVRAAVQKELPYLTTYFRTGGLVDEVLNLGLPAPINIQVSGFDITKTHNLASEITKRINSFDEVSDVYIPQDIDAPALMLAVNRDFASQLGLSQKEVVNNIITSLISNQMIAPSYWVDPKNGNDYMLTVQYPEDFVKTLDDLKGIPIRSSQNALTARLDSVVNVQQMIAPTVVSHYQLQRVIDLYVAPKQEDLGTLSKKITATLQEIDVPENVRITLRGSIEAMHASFKSFGLGLLLSVLLVYLVLVAQFKSFIDPFIILLAVPPGLIGALIAMLMTGTTLNIMSLMGIVMLVGIVVSNSILIVEFTHRLRVDGMALRDAVVTACRVRLRPVLMTSLATIIGLIPMAVALGAGSEVYAALARVIIGGLIFSVGLTVFLVPAAYLLVYRREVS